MALASAGATSSAHQGKAVAVERASGQIGRFGEPVGQVLDAIAKAGIRDNTLVIYSSDNGSFMYRRDDPNAAEDNKRARLVLRFILNNPAITAPIPGLISKQQVDNVALAVKERRKLDVAEMRQLNEAMDEAWANLPAGYQWLRNWEYV